MTYEYSKSGQIVARTANGVRQTYEYDRKGQLLAVKDADGNALERYAYDKAGNMLKKQILRSGRAGAPRTPQSDDYITTTFAFDDANQLVSSTTDGVTTRYAYDAAGRLVKEGSKTYTYGYLDKVMSVTEGDRTYTYTYHADGQLASANYGGKTEGFLWDGLALIQRGDEQFVNEPHVGGGNPVASSKGTSYFNDMLGTTVGSKSNGKYSAAALTAFGENLSVDSPTPTQNSNFFTGKPMVEGLGHAFLMRNYRAGLAKWQTADPMGYPDGWNQLAYCKNDSCNCIDFSGAFARCRYVISTKVLTVFDETTNQAFWTYAKSGNNDPSKQWEQMGPLPVGTWDIIAHGDDLYFQLWYEGDASLDDIATNSVTGQHRDWIRLTINSESHGCICMYPDRDSSWDIMSTLKATEYKWRVNGSENTGPKYRWYGVIEVVE